MGTNLPAARLRSASAAANSRSGKFPEHIRSRFSHRTGARLGPLATTTAWADPDISSGNFMLPACKNYLSEEPLLAALAGVLVGPDVGGRHAQVGDRTAVPGVADLEVGAEVAEQGDLVLVPHRT